MSRDELAIRDLIATWMKASQAGDLETVLGLMTDDVPIGVTIDFCLRSAHALRFPGLGPPR